MTITWNCYQLLNDTDWAGSLTRVVDTYTRTHGLSPTIVRVPDHRVGEIAPTAARLGLTIAERGPVAHQQDILLAHGDER
jgi:phage-related protein